MNDQTPGSATPAGFYPDSSGVMRWWDGSTWTEHTQQAAPVQTVPIKKSHTFRNVMLTLIAVSVLFIGGCLALVGGAVNEVGKSIEKEEAKDKEPTMPTSAKPAATRSD